MPKNWQERDRKLRKRSGKDMKVDNRGIFVVQDAQRKRDERLLRDAKKHKHDMVLA